MTDRAHSPFVFGSLAGLLVVVTAAAGMAPPERAGIFRGLRQGLPITLTENEGRFEIGVLPNVPGPLGHEVVAVGEDYIVVKDAAGVTETAIPLFSVRCVKTLRDPR